VRKLIRGEVKENLIGLLGSSDLVGLTSFQSGAFFRLQSDTAEETMDEKGYQLKSDLLKRALKEADRLDAADEKQCKDIKMAQVLYEIEGNDSAPDDVVDGTEGLLGEDTLGTDWDLADGPIPPPGFWHGTHRRDGGRIPGFTEEEYKEGSSWHPEQVK